MRGLHSTITRLAKLRAAANDGGRGDGRLTETDVLRRQPRQFARLDLPARAHSARAPHWSSCFTAAPRARGAMTAGRAGPSLPTATASPCSIPSRSAPIIANLCFNWFVPADARRGKGEARSIAQMIRDGGRDQGPGPAAGVRHRPVGGRRDDRGDAGELSRAVRRRGDHRRPAVRDRRYAARRARADARQRRARRRPAGRARRRRGAADRRKPPILSVWHGSGDHVVAPSNGEAYRRPMAPPARDRRGSGAGRDGRRAPPADLDQRRRQAGDRAL